jgi:hypothetical protein
LDSLELNLNSFGIKFVIMIISKININTINKARIITVVSVILGILFDYFF